MASIRGSDNLKYLLCFKERVILKVPFQISGVDEDQFGEYTCEASNRHGSASEKMELYESRIPICPPVCGDYNLNGGGEAKSCSALLSSLVAVMIAFLCRI